MWALAQRSYDARPWIVFDYKGDELIKGIDRIEEVRIDKAPPKQAGLFVVRPGPHEHDLVKAFLWKVWKQRNTGLFFDEGYMVSGQGKKCEPLDAILTQGRSLSVPVITLCQRPVWLNRFVISETDIYQIFHLNSDADIDKVAEFVPRECRAELPRFWSHWYDVAKRYHCVVRPVPDDDTILDAFWARMKKSKTLI